MTVKEVIDELKRLDRDKEVKIDLEEYWYEIYSIEDFDEKSIEIKVIE